MLTTDDSCNRPSRDLYQSGNKARSPSVFMNVAGEDRFSPRDGHCSGWLFLGGEVMKNKLTGVMVWMIGMQMPLWAGAAQQPATEAPAGFDTPTLVKNPGSKSASNGIGE